jgi:glycerol-3-phosphate dehydrogenase
VTRRPEELTARVFDVLVVGGGIHGLAAAYDAAQRGLSVALIERDDLGSGSSFNHLKTVHGGLRALQTGSLAKFREGIRERRAIATIAPHLVEPLGFLLPTRGGAPSRSRLALRAALAIDALLGADRNIGLPPHLRLPSGRVVGRARAIALHHALSETAATGAALWYDYQMPRVDRLTLSVAQAAAMQGAVLANHVEALEIVVEARHARGVRARDVCRGDTLDIRSHLVVNAAGALLGAMGQTFGSRHVLPVQKALNVVTSRPFDGVAVGAPLGTGTLFLVPWQGRLMIGTWHDDAECAPGDLDVSEDVLSRFLADVNGSFPWLQLDRDEVTLVHRGAVPATRNGRGAVAMRTDGEVLDHDNEGVGGVISIIGVKYTTARAIAERAVDLAVRKLGRPAVGSRTAATALPGATTNVAAVASALEMVLPTGDVELADHLARSYGGDAGGVVRLGRERPALLERFLPEDPTIGAEVVYAISRELATTLTDVVARRTRLGAAGHPGEPVARAVGQLMQRDCGWTDDRLSAEIAALRRFYLPVRRDLRGNQL